MGSLLEVESLRTCFFDANGGVGTAVDGMSFRLRSRETLALVGESGCGKSVTAYSILRLVSDPPGRIVGGRITFEGRDLLTLPEKDMRAVRGKQIAMIFQDPMMTLNPVLTVGWQIAEAIRAHRIVSSGAALERAVELLDAVGIPEARRRANDYPHRLSGGMRQRAVIATALACEPKVLIADEPTTALDVTIQAQVLELLGSLQRDFGMSLLLITHDLGVVAETADRVVVMYAGRKVEEASVESLFDNPQHPYTQGLIASIPEFGVKSTFGQRLSEIPGIVPSIFDMPTGCAFAARCPRAQSRCRAERPALASVDGEHEVACFFAGARQ
jgi:peptide/nickel transport system ATP-binding protein